MFASRYCLERNRRGSMRDFGGRDRIRVLRVRRWGRYDCSRRRKREFYDPEDGENITCVAKAHTPSFFSRFLSLIPSVNLYIYTRTYLFPPAAFECFFFVFYRPYNQNKNIREGFTRRTVVDGISTTVVRVNVRKKKYCSRSRRPPTDYDDTRKSLVRR